MLTSGIVERHTVISVETEIRFRGCDVISTSGHFCSTRNDKRLIVGPVTTVEKNPAADINVCIPLIRQLNKLGALGSNLIDHNVFCASLSGCVA